MDGPRPGFTALKAGAGFGDWDNSAHWPWRECGVEYSRVHLEVVTHWGEQRRSIKQGGESYLVLWKLLITHGVNVCAQDRGDRERRKVSVKFSSYLSLSESGASELRLSSAAAS